MQLVDLSNNNAAEPDWHALAQHAGGVWLKVSEGATFTDQTFARRARAARAAGLRIGGYHFARPSRDSAQAQADHFVSVLGAIGRRDLRPVLDLEANDAGLLPSELVAWARGFVQAVRAQTGVGALVYGSSSFLAGLDAFRPIGYGLWLADYGPDDGREHAYSVPRPWKRIVAHQYTSKGAIGGVAGRVDLSSAARLRPLLAHPVAGLL